MLEEQAVARPARQERLEATRLVSGMDVEVAVAVDRVQVVMEALLQILVVVTILADLVVDSQETMV